LLGHSKIYRGKCEERTGEVTSRIAILIGVLILATLVALLHTFKEYRQIMETLVLVLGVSGSLLGILQYFRE
jgi:hypothetical protein